MRVMIKQSLFSSKVISLLLQLKVTYPTLQFPYDIFRSNQALKGPIWVSLISPPTCHSHLSAFQTWKKLTLTPFMDLKFFPLLREVGFTEQWCLVHVCLSISLTMFNCLIFLIIFFNKGRDFFKFIQAIWKKNHLGIGKRHYQCLPEHMKMNSRLDRHWFSPLIHISMRNQWFCSQIISYFTSKYKETRTATVRQ